MSVSNMERAAVIGAEVDAWRQLKERFANALPDTAFVIMDARERVVKRIDKPRVPNFPKLQFDPPSPYQPNWSLFDRHTAEAGVSELDRLLVAFAPHRTVHINTLIDERLAALDQAAAYARRIAADEALEDDDTRSLRP
ncbi:hypothetical protein [Pseudoxanthomonas kaohsiungensis]|uniref:Uncharacterized protein n=1 Tax=Pseudoxanthomonas kaohsiungensis TaxID=283923 RepID=A0ABW3LXL4_9GAMM|nr:hypothetical protein [Pseudoxanthomonas kaohsiungensis]KAF1702882.1 hypothetical protein CSC66_08905 [Pseudoxanthomonas kaohsiungensis]